MIPGAGTSLLNKNNEKESINRIKKFLNIMDSMTQQELDGPISLFTPSRIVRLAKGSGVTIQEV
jgi:signal recognition particle subunit SRP54